MQRFLLSEFRCLFDAFLTLLLVFQCNQQSFHDEFLRCIASIIICPSNSTFVGHALQFISSFLTLEIGSSSNNGESHHNDSTQSDLFHPILQCALQFFDEVFHHDIFLFLFSYSFYYKIA